MADNRGNPMSGGMQGAQDEALLLFKSLFGDLNSKISSLTEAINDAQHSIQKDSDQRKKEALRQAAEDRKRKVQPSSTYSSTSLKGDILSAAQFRKTMQELFKRMTDEVKKGAKVEGTEELSAIISRSQHDIEHLIDARLRQAQENNPVLEMYAKKIATAIVDREHAIATGEGPEAIAKYDKQIEDSRAAIQDINRQLEQEVLNSEEVQSKMKSIISSLDSMNEELVNRQSAVMDELDGIIDKTRGMSESASHISDYVAQGLQRIDSKTNGSMYEQYMDRMSKISKNLEESIKEYQEKLDKDEDLDDIQKKYYEEQLKLLKKQKELVDKASPLRDELTDAAKSLRQTGQSLIKSFSTSAIKALENRYLNSYLEGFQTVYNSIEQTRNSISARLRLNQGDYNELQESIHEALEQRNLAGSISQSDVNEMIVSMSQAGITDLDTLETFSILAAKAKASGSALDLTNEETLQLLLAEMQQGTTLDQLETLIDRVISSEQATTDKLGNKMALSNGALNQVLNEILDVDQAQNKTFDTKLSDITSGIYSKGLLFTKGVDDTIISSIIKDMTQGTLSSMPAFQQYLVQAAGMSPEELKTQSYAYQTDAAYRALKQIIDNADANILPYLKEVYGLQGDNLDYMRLQSVSLDSITPPDDFYKGISFANEEMVEDLKEGNYLSKTAQVKVEQQNDTFEKALKAEQKYEGDKIFTDQYNGLINAIDSVAMTIQETAFNVGSMLLSGKGNLGSGGSSGGLLGSSKQAGALGDFLSGSTSTTAGKVGVYGGEIVGAGIAVYNVADTISEGIKEGVASEQIAANVFGDTGVWGGIGATIGAAFGGPLGAAIGGSVGSAVSPFFGKLADFGAKWGTSGSVTSGLEEVSDLLESAALELYNAAQEQSEAAESQIKQLEIAKDSYSLDEKYRYLQDKMDAEELVRLNDTQIADKFEELIAEEIEIQKAKKKEAEQEKIKQSIVTGSATGIANLAGEYISRLKGGAQETEFSFNEVQSLIGKQNAVDIINYALNSDNADEAISSLVSTMDLPDVAKNGVTDLLKGYVNQIQKRKSVYDTNNDTFRTRWEDIQKENPNVNIDTGLHTLLNAYSETYLGGTNLPGLKYDENGKPVIVDGLPILEDNDGVYYNNAKFKTGLTDVPYDNYPALLHSGERILTREEAKAYNKFSSYAINTLANDYDSSNVTSGNVSSQVFNTNQYGTDGVKNAITSQTQTVQDLLKQVLQAINNLTLALSSQTGGRINANVLRMNSNATQLMTI